MRQDDTHEWASALAVDHECYTIVLLCALLVKHLVAVTDNVLPLPLLLSGLLLLPVLAFSAFVKGVLTLVAQVDICVLSRLVLD